MSTVLPPPPDELELVLLLEDDVLLLLPHPATATAPTARMEQTDALLRFTLTPLLWECFCGPLMTCGDMGQGDNRAQRAHGSTTKPRSALAAILVGAAASFFWQLGTSSRALVTVC